MAINATIRGHQAYFKFFMNNVEQIIDTITSVSINQDSSLSKHLYVGNPTPESDMTMMGYTGSFQMEVRNALIDDFIDIIVSTNLRGVGHPDLAFFTRELYSDGTSRSYVYGDARFKMSGHEIGTLEAKVTKSIEFMAPYRVLV